MYVDMRGESCKDFSFYKTISRSCWNIHLWYSYIYLLYVVCGKLAVIFVCETSCPSTNTYEFPNRTVFTGFVSRDLNADEQAPLGSLTMYRHCKAAVRIDSKGKKKNISEGHGTVW